MRTLGYALHYILIYEIMSVLIISWINLGLYSIGGPDCQLGLTSTSISWLSMNIYFCFRLFLILRSAYSGCPCKTEYSEDNNMEIEVMRSRAGSEIIKLSDITRSCHEFSVFYGYKGLRQKSCSLTKWSLWRS